MKVRLLLLILALPLLLWGKVIYKLAYTDHFNGTRLNEKMWSRIDQGGADWNRHMSTREDLIQVKGGQLHAYGKRNEDLSADPRRVLTGGIKSQGKLAMKYGKVEIRCKLEGQKGAWPAIWMMPEKPVRGWPADGEIDILERLNFDTVVYQTVHSKWTKQYPGDPPYTHQAPVHADTWNTYGLEWTPESITWTINGTPTHTYAKRDENPDQFPWTTPFYLMIDMQLGGSWVGAIDESTLPTAMHIDWVKFYSASENGKELTEFYINGALKEKPAPAMKRPAAKTSSKTAPKPKKKVRAPQKKRPAQK